MSKLPEESNPLLKLARTLGKTTSKLKKELAIAEELPARTKPFVRAPLKGNLVTSEQVEQEEQELMALARAHGISTEGKSSADIRRELNLKMLEHSG